MRRIEKGAHEDKLDAGIFRAGRAAAPILARALEREHGLAPQVRKPAELASTASEDTRECHRGHQQRGASAQDQRAARGKARARGGTIASYSCARCPSSDARYRSAVASATAPGHDGAVRATTVIIITTIISIIIPIIARPRAKERGGDRRPRRRAAAASQHLRPPVRAVRALHSRTTTTNARHRDTTLSRAAAEWYANGLAAPHRPHREGTGEGTRAGVPPCVPHMGRSARRRRGHRRRWGRAAAAARCCWYCWICCEFRRG